MQKQTLKSRFTIGQMNFPHKKTTPPRCYEDIEFIYTKNGCVTINIENTENPVILQTGDAVLIPPGVAYSIKAAAESKAVSVRFPPGLFSGAGFRKYAQPLIAGGKAYVYKLTPEGGVWQAHTLDIINKLTQFKKDDLTAHELLFHGLLLQLWDYLYHNIFKASPFFHTYQKLYKRISPAIDYIEGHYTENITLDTLAALVNLSPGTFCRYFNRLTGAALTHYINKLRIRKSRELLTGTDKNISDIAFLCGYNNLSHFNREFKKIMGITPSDYRRAGG